MSNNSKKPPSQKPSTGVNDPDHKAQSGIETKVNNQEEKRGLLTILAPYITISIAMIVLATAAWWGLRLILPQPISYLDKQHSSRIKELPDKINMETISNSAEGDVKGIGESTDKPPQDYGTIDAELASWLTSYLKLTVEEAQTFWPLYNDYSSRRDKLNQDKNSLLEYVIRNFENLTREELTEAGNRVIEMGNQEASLATEYHIRFGKVLPPEKVILLYGAEAQFKALSLNQLHDSHK